MVELVDTPDLKSCGHLPVRVQVPLRVRKVVDNQWINESLSDYCPTKGKKEKVLTTVETFFYEFILQL